MAPIDLKFIYYVSLFTEKNITYAMSCIPSCLTFKNPSLYTVIYLLSPPHPPVSPALCFQICPSRLQWVWYHIPASSNPRLLDYITRSRINSSKDNLPCFTKKRKKKKKTNFSFYSLIYPWWHHYNLELSYLLICPLHSVSWIYQILANLVK